ncbi:Trm112 family protein [Candidatus Dependentiae bacterium]
MNKSIKKCVFAVLALGFAITASNNTLTMNNTRECGICMDDKNVDEFVLLECGHNCFCKGCLGGVIDTTIKDKKTVNILKCPLCEHTLTHKEIVKITNNNNNNNKKLNQIKKIQLKKHKKIKEHKKDEMDWIHSEKNWINLLTNKGNLQNCPNCHVLIEKIKDTSSDMECAPCKHAFCWVCNIAYKRDGIYKKQQCTCCMYSTFWPTCQVAKKFKKNLKNKISNKNYLDLIIKLKKS